jgi:hypothetical protein
VGFEPTGDVPAPGCFRDSCHNPLVPSCHTQKRGTGGIRTRERRCRRYVLSRDARSATLPRFHVPPLHALSPAAGTRWPLPCSLSLKPGYRVVVAMATTRQSGIEPSGNYDPPSEALAGIEPAWTVLQAVT